jgi:hypothetical protein
VRARVLALSTVEVVDRCEVVGLVATGRGGRAAAWLATIGYDLPPKSSSRST